MDGSWGTAVWRQLRAAFETLDKAVAACPDALWTGRVWPEAPPSHFPREFAAFW